MEVSKGQEVEDEDQGSRFDCGSSYPPTLSGVVTQQAPRRDLQ